MKRITLPLLLCLAFLSISATLIAQTGYREKENPDYVSQEKIKETLSELQSLRTTLPERVDNSFNKYMRPAVNQGSMGSCGSASRICHMFAYEINNYRDLEATNYNNKYPSHFTWMLTDQNSSKEGMAIFNGIPNSPTYGGEQYSTVFGGNVSWPNVYPQYGWMNGYTKWRSAMNNRLEKAVDVKLNTDEALEYLKWWIYNHQGDSDFNEGGVAGGGAASSGWVTKTIPAGSHEAGRPIVTAYGSTIDHGTVWSGYDDNVEYDLNDNGIIEDDERGALILFNSWGASWGYKGTIYVPYKIVKTYNGGLSAELYYIRKEYKPRDVFRIKMNYDQRCNIKISIGVSDDPNATEPAKITEAEHFKYAGFEAIPLLGKYYQTINTDPMEFGLDLTDLTALGFDTRKDFKYFLVLETKSGSTGEGTLHELDVRRYSYPEGVETGEVIGSIDAPVAITSAQNRYVIPINVPGDEAIAPEYLYVPQTRLSVAAFTSQETSGEGANNGWAKHAIDNTESTYWHSQWQGGSSALPHFIQFEIDSTYTINGFEYLSRQNHTNGRIGNYEFYVSDTKDGTGTLVASGSLDNDKAVKRIFFEGIKGKFVKIVNLKSADGDPNTCMAEFNLFYKPEGSHTSIDEIDTDGITIRQTSSAILVSGVEGIATLSVYDMQGRSMTTQNAVSESSSGLQLSTTHLGKGVYILRVNTPTQSKAVKFIVK